MTGQTERLERLIVQERGECCEGDVETRVETLEGYRSAQRAAADADLRTLKALGNDTRYAIVNLLASAGRELCVCEIDPVLPVSDSAISHALSDLHEAGLVARRKEGTWRYYETTDRAEALLSALAETRGETDASQHGETPDADRTRGQDD